MTAMRWVIGDVQGCARELDDLLERVRFDPGRDELWIAGDLVNRGPDSLAVLRLWRDLAGRAVLGNHDVYALLARSGRRPRKRSDTLGSLFAAPDADELLDRLRGQPLFVRLHDAAGVCSAWLVHAGLHPRWPELDELAAKSASAAHDDDWLESDEVTFAVNVRCCTADGERADHAGPPETCPPPFKPWDEFYRGELLVVHGHWARRGCYRGERTLGLDSGCVYGGELSGWCQEEDRIEQVPSRASGRGPSRVFLGG